MSPAPQATMKVVLPVILALLARLALSAHAQTNGQLLGSVEAMEGELGEQISPGPSIPRELNTARPHPDWARRPGLQKLHKQDAGFQQRPAFPSGPGEGSNKGADTGLAKGSKGQSAKGPVVSLGRFPGDHPVVRRNEGAGSQQGPSQQSSHASSSPVPQNQKQETAAATATTADAAPSPTKASLPTSSPSLLPAEASPPTNTALLTTYPSSLTENSSLPTKAGSVAICLAGGLRQFELTVLSIVQHLFASYPGAHVFVSAPLTAASHKLLLLSAAESITSKAAPAAGGAHPNPWSLKRVRFLAQEPLEEEEAFHKVLTARWSPNGIQGLLQYFQLVEGCSPLIAAQEQQQGFKYDWVVRARPDSYWVGPAPPLASLDPEAYNYPQGCRYGGLNDRFAIGKRRVAEAGLKRLSVLRGLASTTSKAMGHNSERSLKAQLEYLGIPFQALQPLSFCTFSLRPYVGAVGRKYVPMFGLSSTAPVSGAKCRPCRPMLTGQKAASILQQCDPNHGSPYDPPPPPSALTGFHLCNASQEWASGWEHLFDQQAGADAASMRGLWATLSASDCASRLRVVLGLATSYTGPDAEVLCQMRPLGPVLKALSSSGVTFATAKEALAAVVDGATEPSEQNVTTTRGIGGLGGLQIPVLFTCATCPALIHLTSAEGVMAERKESLVLEMQQQGWVLVKCGGKHTSQICLFLPFGPRSRAASSIH